MHWCRVRQRPRKDLKLFVSKMHAMMRPLCTRQTVFLSTWALLWLWIGISSGPLTVILAFLLALTTPTSVALPLLTARQVVSFFYGSAKMAVSFSRLSAEVPASSATRVPLRAPSGAAGKECTMMYAPEPTSFCPTPTSETTEQQHDKEE